jgi:hypothetical protein
MMAFIFHDEKGYYSEADGNLLYKLENTIRKNVRGEITIFADENIIFSILIKNY